MRNALVDAIEKLANNWLDDGFLVIFPGERFDGLDGVPRRRHDELGFTATGSGQHLGLDKACDRPQVGKDRIYEVLTAVRSMPDGVPYPPQMRTI